MIFASVRRGALLFLRVVCGSHSACIRVRRTSRGMSTWTSAQCSPCSRKAVGWERRTEAEAETETETETERQNRSVQNVEKFPSALLSSTEKN